MAQKGLTEFCEKCFPKICACPMSKEQVIEARMGCLADSVLHGEGEQSYRSEDEDLFNAMAPFVERGCYIDIETSDWQKFRLAFDGKTCKRKEGELDYDSNIEIVEAILKDKQMLPMLIGVHPVLDERIHEVLKG